MEYPPEAELRVMLAGGEATKVAELPPCDGKCKGLANYDCIVRGGHSWANFCEECRKVYGEMRLGTGLGKLLIPPAHYPHGKEDREFNLVEILDAADDGRGLTRCPEGCVVEVDGTCPHGYESLLLERGLV